MFFFWKNISAPFLHIPLEGLLGNVGLGDTRGDFVSGEKRLPPCLRVVIPKDLFEGCFLQGKATLGSNWPALSMRNVSAFCWVPDVSFEK